MFLGSSRYAKTPQVVVAAADGGTVKAVKLRQLPTIVGDPTEVQGHDRLDTIAFTDYRDATMFWHIADANTELEAPELTRVTGRIIQVPPS